MNGNNTAKDQAAKATIETMPEGIVEIVSDSGEGAQTCGQLFGTISAKMGNGIWTVEIIPAEIEPPARSRAGASGNRIRIGTEQITNFGDEAETVVAFNEQVLYSRLDVHAYKKGTRLFLDNKWSNTTDEQIVAAYHAAVEEFTAQGLEVVEIPIEEECLKIVPDPRRGKNIWVLGLLCALYDRDADLARAEITNKLARKGEEVVRNNINLFNSGYDWTIANIAHRFSVPVKEDPKAKLVMNGNQAAALGAMAAGFEVCSMYPITPATSVSHYLANTFYKVGGFVHQAEDEISAMMFALGVSYAGKTCLTVTSGPGLALKTEAIGLAVMAELPVVIVLVQRGGPSTGLPTKVEQGDLMSAMFGATGDAPKIVLAPTSIEDCFHDMVEARKLAEEYRSPVIVLTDANLATGQQAFYRPELLPSDMAPPLDLSPRDPDVPAYNWDPKTGLSDRPIPGQKNGMYRLTGLAHDAESKVAYDSAINQQSSEARSLKLSTLHKKLPVPEVYGDDSGDLLLVGWGSTKGAIEEAVDRVRAKGGKVSSTHLHYLSPMQPGIKEIFSRFKKVMTIEINYSDPADNPNFAPEVRRMSQLATLLRAQTLVDIDCWSKVPGHPLPPGMIEDVIMTRLGLQS